MRTKLPFILILGLVSLSAFADHGLVSLMTGLSQKHNLPGIGVAVLKGSDLVLKEAVGVKEVGKPDQIRTKDKFHLGSQTKAMTAMLIAKLVDQKRIKFDTKISTLLPGVNFHPDHKNTTIEMLLLHKAGFNNVIPEFDKIRGELNLASTVTKAREIAVRKILNLPGSYKPNTKDQYSNVGYLILGHIIEKLWGRSYEDLAKRELFLSLNIKSCAFNILNPSSVDSPLNPVGHIIQRGILTPYYGDNLAIWASSGNVHCNLEDWGKFVQLQMDLINGKSSYLSKTTTKKLFEEQSSSAIGYTLGALYRVNRSWIKEEAFTHTGTNLVNYSRVWILPKSNIAVLLTTNRGGDESFSETGRVLKEANDALNSIAEYLVKKY